LADKPAPGLGVGGAGGAAAAGGKMTRDYFPETGYWNPALVTDKLGEAKVRIEMPDSITKWQLQARGVDVHTVSGDADVEIITRKDFFIELKTPTILHEGDKLKVTARVHHAAALKN